MKTFNPIFSLAFTLALTATGLAAAPSDYIVTYTVPECVDAGGDIIGKALAVTTTLKRDKCADIRLFTSFEAGVISPCPGKKVATVMAYPEADCGGKGVSAGTLPTDGSRGGCKEIALNLPEDNVLDLFGGRSAKLTCA